MMFAPGIIIILYENDKKGKGEIYAGSQFDQGNFIKYMQYGLHCAKSTGLV